MKVSNKAHRVTAMAAAVLMLISVLFSSASTVITMISVVTDGFAGAAFIGRTVVRLVTNIFVAALAIIALFRGKKDVMAAVLFLLVALITAARSVVSRAMSIPTILASNMGGHEKVYVTSSVILIIAGVIAVAVRVLLALECFKPGMISGNMMKLVLILLPIVCAILNVVGSVVQMAGTLDRQNNAMYLVGVIVSAVILLIGYVPEILMGIAFAIPVYEKQDPDCIGEVPTTI